MTLDSFLGYFEGPRKTSRGYMVRCPAHADRHPSLAISEADDGRILIYCFSGCSTEEITTALGLSLGDLFPDSKPNPAALRHAKRRKKSEAALDSARGCRADACRNAEKIITAATGVDISGWTPGQLDTAMDAVADARLTLIHEAEETEGGRDFG